LPAPGAGAGFRFGAAVGTRPRRPAAARRAPARAARGAAPGAGGAVDGGGRRARPAPAYRGAGLHRAQARGGRPAQRREICILRPGASRIVLALAGRGGSGSCGPAGLPRSLCIHGSRLASARGRGAGGGRGRADHDRQGCGQAAGSGCRRGAWDRGAGNRNGHCGDGGTHRMGARDMPDVVIAPTWLGDAIMALPALVALRAADPGRRWQVLAGFPLAGFELWNGGRAREVVILPNSFHAALTACRLCARRRVGYARDARGWLLHPAIPVPAAGTLPGHESFRYLELLRRAGLIAALPAEEPERLRVPLHPRAAAVEAWRRKLGGPSAVAMHVGAAGSAAKRWLPERFAQLAGALSARGLPVALIG